MRPGVGRVVHHHPQSASVTGGHGNGAGCTYFLMSTLQMCSMDATSIRPRKPAHSRSTASSELSAIACLCVVPMQ